eukprot:2929909-Amphidinium_carterae.1
MMREHGITSWEPVWNADEAALSLFSCPTKGSWQSGAQQKPKWTASAGQHCITITLCTCVYSRGTTNAVFPFAKSRNHCTLLEFLFSMDGYAILGRGFLRSSSTSKFVLVEVGTTGLSQLGDLAIMKVFKSEAKPLACAASARDVLNMTLVKPKAAHGATSAESGPHHGQCHTACRDSRISRLTRVPGSM